MIGGNLSAFLEGERSQFVDEYNAAARETCRANSERMRREEAVLHNHWPSLSAANEADTVAMSAREAFRTAHRKSVQLRDQIAAIETDLHYDEFEEDGAYLCV